MNRPTECDDLIRVTPRQETAIELLISGQGDAATAKAMGMHRTTISRWRAYHPVFQAELARRRSEMFGLASERFRALAPKALDVLETELAGRKNCRHLKRCCATRLGIPHNICGVEKSSR